MIPYKTCISFDRNSSRALYVQLANQFVALIKNRTLTPSAKLPSSRSLAELLNIHRKTVIACYEELLLQGWIESIPKKGTYVHHSIPLLQHQIISSGVTPATPEKLGKTSNPENSEKSITLLKSGFSFLKEPLLNISDPDKNSSFQYLNDGVSDIRLTPINEIAKEYRYLANRSSSLAHLAYGSTYGNTELRHVLVNYLNNTRGLSITKDQILITRGSQMGLYLASQILLKNDCYVIIGETNYSAADLTFSHAGAKLLRVTVDKDGMDTDAIELLCKKRPIKAVYVTPHHHHPTTATLSAQRRMHLLNLARTYSFAIIEDDYDYDFHYDHAPILPLASHDLNGNVIYVGSVCKTVAPAYRIGYLIASIDFVDQCAKLRRLIDRQGDALLEATFARFIKNGDLDRHIRKTLKVYRQRRDLFCALLKKNFENVFSFEIPKGGMAVWVLLDKKYSWLTITEAAKRNGLIIGDWERYDRAEVRHNGIRMGFATYNSEEIHALLLKLKLAFDTGYPVIRKRKGLNKV